MAAHHSRAELEWIPLLQGRELLMETKEVYLNQAKQKLGAAMLALHTAKGKATPSGHRQIAALIVMLGDARDQIEKVEK